MRVTFALLLALAPALAAAQMNKCMDDKRQVTYSNLACEKQGLKSVGTVTQDRVTSMPFTQPSGAAPAKPAEKGAAAAAPKPAASILDPEPAPAGGSLAPNLPGSAPRR
jgi:hypothetical protein